MTYKMENGNVLYSSKNSSGTSENTNNAKEFLPIHILKQGQQVFFGEYME